MEKILIIGAGAAGLMAARILMKQGAQVTVFEAEERLGGRILDTFNPHTALPIKLGAEFIHGEANLTFSLLKEARIPYVKVAGQSYRSQAGKLVHSKQYGGYWPDLMAKIKVESSDISLTDFLSKHFSDEKYTDLRKEVSSFAEGYDAADPDNLSLLALKNEWLQNEETQYRIEGGYSRLINYLSSECIAGGVSILTQKTVCHVNWTANFVEVITTDSDRFSGNKVIVTLPLGVLQIKDGSTGFIYFTPPLPSKMAAVRTMGYGSAIKIILLFKTAFWQDIVNEAGFIFSEEVIPTWWTQLPDKTPLLTGWLAGPKTEKLNNKTESEIIETALQSLSNIFGRDRKELRRELISTQICNWREKAFSRGAYAYATVNTPYAPKVLAAPVENTLFFAGEATFQSQYTGTVEAALQSGKAAAEKVLSTAILSNQ